MTGASRIWPWLALALALLLVLQNHRLAGVEVSQSKQAAAQAQQAQAAMEIKTAGRLQHAAGQQENTHDYNRKLAALEAGRTADAARIAGLQHDIRTAATRNAQLAGDAAACRDLADQHQRLAALVGEGAGVVGQLVGLVERRDAQVNALIGQVRIDRDLLAQP
ncbi:hypothetical protein DJFAAGMI_01412 [Comamonas sp. PE63]|uniref:DUF2514 family protein n=1 Tax=Comamonas brasiliensis TaxID=1812482 RepID=A0ABS5LQ94_9BURK|nr:hypothetical protein [Comamonas sp. PE63]